MWLRPKITETLLHRVSRAVIEDALSESCIGRLKKSGYPLEIADVLSGIPRSVSGVSHVLTGVSFDYALLLICFCASCGELLSTLRSIYKH